MRRKANVKIVIPDAPEVMASLGMRARSGTYRNIAQISQWVPGRAAMPNGKIATARPG